MKTLITIIILSLTISLYSQDSTVILDGRNYVYEDSNWFVKESNGQKFKLISESFTVKLKENIPMTALENYCNARGIEIKRENELGYIDLKLPNNSHFRTMFYNFNNLGIFESITVNSYAKLDLIPDDEALVDQYYLSSWDTYTRPHINAEDAWDTETGATNQVIVAVIDVGVDFDNQDLIDAIDLGWDFYLGQPNPDPLDDNHHGTSMAGIIAAKTNNTLAIAGIAGGWTEENPGAIIMDLRVGIQNPFGGGFDETVLDDAILFAANNGAKVINMSWSAASSPEMVAALNYAYNNKGCYLVSSAGNNEGHFGFPGRHPLVAAISGINKNWTHYGAEGTTQDAIDITAPAEEIVSLRNNLPGGSNANYGIIGTGTSASCAMAAGVAALLLSYNPNLAPMDIRNVINSSAVYEPQMENNPLKFGNGLLKADRALRCLSIANGIIPDWPTNLSVVYNPPAKPVFTWSTVLPTLESVITHYNIYRSKAPGKFSFNKAGEIQHNGGIKYHSWTDNSNLTPGTHYYRVTTVDNLGNESITSNEVSITTGIEQKVVENIHFEFFDYNLEQNFPNPFNPFTKIKYSVKETGMVELKLYDVLGREVKTLSNELKQPGYYEVNFNANALASGIYIYKLQVNDYVSTKKLILLR